VKRLGDAVRRVVDGTIRRLPSPLARAYYVAADRTGVARYAAPRERATCPACGSQRVELLQPLQLHGCIDGQWVGFASGCRRCGVVFANPMPPLATLECLYSPAGEWGQSRKESDGPEKIPPTRYLIGLFEPVRQTLNIEAPPPGGAVLDFGCGHGEFLNVLQDFGWITYGIEPAEKGAFERHHELQAIPESPDFDLAIAHHVLEHVSDPLRILRLLHGCLKPQGLLLLSVPRLDTLPEHGDSYYCINDRAHILSYTRDAMATLLGMAGFEAIDLNPPPGQPAERWRARKRLRMFGRKSGSSGASIAHPLVAARRALRKWQTTAGPARTMFGVRISPRAAAAIMNFERERQHLRDRRSSHRGSGAAAGNKQHESDDQAQ